MKKTILFWAMLLVAGVASASIKNVKYATFGTPGSNATYSAPTYTWTGSTSNLMTVFEFTNGELANYTTLTFTFSNLVDGPVRMGYYVGSTFTEFGNGYYSAGTKTVDLTALGVDLATVTKIAFGGRSNAGSCTIKWADVYLENDDDAVLTALFVAPSNAASYSVPFYGCSSAGSNNLMDVYTGSAGDFSKYSNGVLQFTISNLSSGNMVRVGYHNGSSFSEFGSGFGSSGTKTVDISGQSSNAAAATTIKFGAKSGTAASPFVTIRPDQMYLVRSEAYTREFTQSQKSTVWLPFALTAEEVAAVAGKFYELTAADGGTLTFTEVAGATEAYKPYVFVATSTGTPFSDMKSKTIVAPKACSYTVGDYTFVGSMKDTTVPNGAYGYNSTNGVFSKTTSDAVTIAPFRAYIIYNGGGGAGARELNCIFSDGEVTGIETVRQSLQQDGVMYNLQGQRVGQSHKGLFIMNGRKYVVK